jgi:hypothetical protein
MSAAFHLVTALAIGFAAQIVSAQEPQPGQLVTLTQQTPVYRDLPTGLYCADSSVAAVLSASEQVRFVASRRLPCAFLLGREYWEVERTNPNLPPAERRGFVRRS